MTSKSPSLIIVLLAAIIAITPLAIDMYLPAMPGIASDLDTHIGNVQQSLSVFLAAYAAGMLLFGPLVDVYGRRPFALIGLFGFTLSSFALAKAEHIEWFMFFRIAQAFFGAAATVVVPGIVRHLYQEHTAKGLSYLSMIMMLAPLLAPGIGSGVLLVSDWTGIFWLLGFYGVIIMALIWKYLPEIPQSHDQRGLDFIGGYKVVLGNKEVRPLILSMMFGTFGFFCYVTAVSFVYINYFGVDEFQFSLLFGLNVVALMMTNYINSRLVTRKGPLFMLRSGIVIALISSLLLCAFNYFGLGLWFTVLSVALLMAGLVLVGTNTDALVLMRFPNNTGTATAVTGTLRFGSGAIAGPLLAYFYTGTALPFSLLMLAGVIGVLVCQLWFAVIQPTGSSTIARVK